MIDIILLLVVWACAWFAIALGVMIHGYKTPKAYKGRHRTVDE